MARSEAEEVVASLRRFISRGEYGLREVPQLVEEVLRRKLWRKGGRTFASFPEFVEANPPPGLGAALADVRQLIAHETTILDLFDKETTLGKGRNHDNVMISRAGQGNDRQYALRRLREQRPDLHARVLLPKKHPQHLSPHGAMVEAGFRPRAYRLPLTVDGLVAALHKHFNADQIAEIVRRLSEPF